MGYWRDGELFTKVVPAAPDVPDRGAVAQVYVGQGFCELEGVGTLTAFGAGPATLVERWSARPLSRRGECSSHRRRRYRLSHVIGIDVSTTATKAILVDGAGHVVGVARSEYDYDIPRPMWTEQDPRVWWEAAIDAISRLLVETDLDAGAVSAIGLTGQMHGSVLLDEAGEVIRPAILWNDQRTSAQCDEIRDRVGAERLIAITGNDALTGFTAPKLLWVAEQRAGELGPCPHPAPAQGLREVPAHRRARRRRRRRIGDHPLRPRGEVLVRRGPRRARHRSRSVPTGVRGAGDHRRGLGRGRRSHRPPPRHTGRRRGRRSVGQRGGCRGDQQWRHGLVARDLRRRLRRRP